MTASWLDSPFDFRHHTKIIVVVDVVESVLLMERNEHEFIQRWHHFVGQTRELLAKSDGRMHKSLGDGLMLEFAEAHSAIRAAFGIHELCGQSNQDLPADRQMHLRIGAHTAEFVADEHDIYGTDINLTARIATLAGPGEIVVSAPLRDCLTDGLDADIEDLGECHLKHVSEPVHVYRVGPVGHAPVVRLDATVAASLLRPTLIVVPFTARMTAPEHQVLGEILAEEIIAGLSRCAQINVISRLSTTALRHRESELPQLRALIAAGADATYALTGAYRIMGERISLIVELADLRSGHVVWADSLKSTISSVLAGEDEITPEVVSASSMAVARVEAERATSKPLPTLQSATLHMGAVAMMHRAGRSEFERVREMLEHLIERHPRVAGPRAWLAKWHVLRVTRGLAESDGDTAKHALALTHRALDLDSDCSLAMAVEGFVQCHLVKDLDAAAQCFEAALRTNPNDSLAWLFQGVLHAFRNEGAPALADTQRALRLSPLDPLKYYYESLAATAALSARKYDLAMELALKSLRSNQLHSSTLRVLVIAQTKLGLMDQAQLSAQRLRKLEPALTISGYLSRNPSAPYETGKEWAEALRLSGIPN